MLDKKFFLRLGPKVRNRYKTHIFTKARDVFDKKFPGYNKTPGSIKYGERKRARKFKRQDNAFSNSTAPVLTSDFREDFSVIRTKDTGFWLGWAIYGERVKHLAKVGRVVTSQAQPLPQKVIDYMLGEAKPYIDKHKLPKSKTIRFRIGK